MFHRKKKYGHIFDDSQTGGRNWKEVLHEIYLVSPVEYSAGKVGWTEKHPISKKLKLSALELNNAIEFLKKNGLVATYMADEKDTMNLTKKGFEIALLNEKLAKEEKSQKVLIFLTYVLAISSIFTFLSSLNIIYDSYVDQNFLVTAFIIGLIIGGYRIFQKSKN